MSVNGQWADRAGNVEQIKQLEFVINKSITIDKLIQKIEQFYIDGKITKKLVKNSLIRQMQYNLILKQLKLYNHKKWMDDEVYDIIKKDIEYLKTT
ncbi:MAG: hypothetical protein ABIJ83_02645 [Patescibacteria group bacterium]